MPAFIQGAKMTAISGHTTPFAVLGHPIGHTLSPVMHNASIKALGMDAVYLAFDVAPERLMGQIGFFRELGFGGLNLTVPLKERAFEGLQAIGALDESARIAGAVNTVQFTDAGPVGHTTDGTGFLRALQEAFGRTVRGDTVFFLGCGGAGRTAALAAAREGARRLLLSDLDAVRVEKLQEDLAALAPETETETVPANETAAYCRTADLVVQASPVGMKPDDPELLPAEAFREGQRVLDLIYMHPETALMRTARRAGAEVANGLGMLLHQGARSFEIWTGREPDTAAMRAALETAVYGRNAV
jgi:shikimate dehydrogenase